MWSSDVFNSVCSLLSSKDVLVLSRTCRTYHVFGSRDVVWKQFETWQDHDDKIVHLSRKEYIKSEEDWIKFLSQYSGGLRKFNGKYMAPLLEMPKYIKIDWLRLNLPTTFNISRFATRMTIFDLSESIRSLLVGRSREDSLIWRNPRSNSYMIYNKVESPEGSVCGIRKYTSKGLDLVIYHRITTMKTSHKIKTTTERVNYKRTARVRVPKQRKQYKKYLHSKRRFSPRYR